MVDEASERVRNESEKLTDFCYIFFLYVMGCSAGLKLMFIFTLATPPEHLAPFAL